MKGSTGSGGKDVDIEATKRSSLGGGNGGASSFPHPAAVLFPSSLLSKCLSCQHNRTATQLKGNIGKYAGGGSVTARGSCGREVAHGTSFRCLGIDASIPSHFLSRHLVSNGREVSRSQRPSACGDEEKHTETFTGVLNHSGALNLAH
jgi:hypothetical protein